MALATDSMKTTEDKEEIVIFDGSSTEEINHAKSFWKSLTLQPPLESRLVSADIRQRLRIAAPVAETIIHPPTHTRDELKTAVFLHHAHENILKDEKEKYQKTMSQREAALNLLHKQRMERLQKEMISLPFKPKQTELVVNTVDSNGILDALRLSQEYDEFSECRNH